jgi:RNA ligase (TIGR02306 family)
MSERKLASVRKISSILEIPDADNIELAKVDGWQVVVKKNEFNVGELVVYFEIDSWLPTKLAPFLTKEGKEPHEFEGILGERLRTVKLRKMLSQGLILPITGLEHCNIMEGLDLTEVLGIKKWERPLPAQMQGQAKGYFPQFLRKTDQERAQNLVMEIADSFDNDEQFEITIKLDGSSLTAYYNNGEIGVCSRNLELKLNEENAGNIFIKTCVKTNLLEALKILGRNLAVQGELMGEGIQGNREGLKEHQIYVFDIFDIDEQVYLTPSDRVKLVSQLEDLGFTGDHCPILADATCLESKSIDDLLLAAEGKSLNHAVREGLVYKRLDGKFSFKTIANNFLLKERD